MESKPKIRVFTKSYELQQKPSFCCNVYNNWAKSIYSTVKESLSINDKSKQKNYFYNLRQ